MTLVEEIKRMIESALESMEITSANPTHTNVLKQVNAIETPDLDQFISNDKSPDAAKETKKTSETIKKIDRWEKGTVGTVSRFTTSQTSNLVRFVTNPLSFILGSVIKRAGPLLLAVAIFAAVKQIITELLKPGRLLDIRYKRIVKDELIQFRRREEQQKLKQGFTSIIITTGSGLRGGEGQATNTLNSVAGRTEFPDNIGYNPLMIEAAGPSASKSRGNGGFGRFGRR